MLFGRKKQPQAYVQDYLADQPYLSGIVTGLAAGLAIGFLFAPRSGKELRKQIAGTVSDQTKEVEDKWNETKAQAKDAIGTIKSNVVSAADKVEDEFSGYTHKAGKYADEARKEANYLADETKSGIDKFKDTLKAS